ncbi:hypothetical protein PWT90_10146 [Aphanocladium album]|nr:hypothetical protein PWT90_10146 [Aphanocladium album]
MGPTVSMTLGDGAADADAALEAVLDDVKSHIPVEADVESGVELVVADDVPPAAAADVELAADAVELAADAVELAADAVELAADAVELAAGAVELAADAVELAAIDDLESKVVTNVSPVAASINVLGGVASGTFRYFPDHETEADVASGGRGVVYGTAKVSVGLMLAKSCFQVLQALRMDRRLVPYTIPRSTAACPSSGCHNPRVTPHEGSGAGEAAAVMVTARPTAIRKP